MREMQNHHVLDKLGRAAAAVVVIGSAGCAESPELGSTAGVSFEQFRAAAQAHRESDGGYVVEWDLVLHGDDELYAYWERLQSGALTVYSVSGQDIIWNPTQRKNLTYCIGSTFTATQKIAVINALIAASDNGWSAMADVKFVHVVAQDGAGCTNANTNVVFDVNRVEAHDYLARAFFPNTPRGSRQLLVDTDSFAADLEWPLANIMGHELGHALGLRHEHTRPESGTCFEDNQWRAVTAYDAASIMHYPQCNGTSTNLAFTNTDRSGIATLYGPPVVNKPPVAQVTQPADGGVVSPTFPVVSYLVDMDIVRGELYVDGVLYKTLTAPPFEFEVTNASEGQHVLRIKAIDSAGLVGDKTIRVTVVKQKDPGPGTGDPDPVGPGNDPIPIADPDHTDEVSGGCAVGEADPSWLIAVGLFGLRRRRRRRGQRLAALATASISFAILGCGAVTAPASDPMNDPANNDDNAGPDAGTGPDGTEAPVLPKCQGPRVRPVYMVPADREMVAEYSAAIRDALAELQAFFHNDVGAQRTYCVGDVEIVKTPHTASWYLANPSPRGANLTFWDNAGSDAVGLTELKDGNPDTLWLFLFDVDVVDGQSYGAVQNLIMLPAIHMRGLAGREAHPKCYYTGTIAYYLPAATGVSQPQDCVNREPTCPSDSLMWLGWANFPATYLLPDQRSLLAASSFLVAGAVPASFHTCMSAPAGM
jgi:serralysin